DPLVEPRTVANRSETIIARTSGAIELDEDVTRRSRNVECSGKIVDDVAFHNLRVGHDVKQDAGACGMADLHAIDADAVGFFDVKAAGVRVRRTHNAVGRINLEALE